METGLVETLREAEVLLKRLDNLEKFNRKYSVRPTRESVSLVESMQVLSDSIPEIGTPTSHEELIQTELKRRIHGEASFLEQQLSGRPYEFGTVINILGIPEEDLASLRPWLEANKTKTQESIERLFHSRDLEGYELAVSSDIPNVRMQVEAFSDVHIQRYHKTIGKFLESLTSIGKFLRDINAVPTTNDRSYFNQLTNNLAISVPKICFSKEDGTHHINEKELIMIYGHEGMGHALNFVVTRSANMPYFLTQLSTLNVATAESVAQFYENQLLEDLKNSRATQKKLGIESIFDEIYQETKDTNQLDEYQKKMIYYAICVLGDKSLGDYNNPETLKNKIEIINQVAIDKGGLANWMQQKRYSFDSEGNLEAGLVSELRYCANPVTRAIEEFKRCGINYVGDGRTLMDTTMLRGLWTPIGFVDNARLQAMSHAAQR